MKDKVITIFGGAGFLGSHIIQDLAREGYRIKIISRAPESVYDIKTAGTVGQIVSYTCDYDDAAAINKAVEGSYAVINLIGILYQKKKNKFKKIHTDLLGKIAKACQKQEINKFIHVSALGVDKGNSNYAKSKREGEKLVKKIFPRVTILRPSVVFGPGDSFFNMFAKLSVLLPALPLIGGGKTRFQPVFVGDIAEAIGKIIISENDKFEGQIYQLGGPEIVTLKRNLSTPTH